MNLQIFEPMSPDLGPTRSELNCLRPGRFVRLALESGSRFWARVASHRQPNGTYRAIADDSVGPIRRGDAVCFERRHVFEIV